MTSIAQPNATKESSKLDDNTAKLQNRVQQQLDRLLLQLKDCEDLREDLDEEEYEETRQDTLNQMEEFRVALDKMCKGNLSLMSSLEHVRDAIRAAVSETFQTPDTIALFVKRQPEQLRQRLERTEQRFRLKEIGEEEYVEQACEVLLALKRLGEDLSAKEQQLLRRYQESSFTTQFEKVPNEDAKGKGQRHDGSETVVDGNDGRGMKMMGKQREILGVATTQIREALQRHDVTEEGDNETDDDHGNEIEEEM